MYYIRKKQYILPGKTVESFLPLMSPERRGEEYKDELSGK